MPGPRLWQSDPPRWAWRPPRGANAPTGPYEVAHSSPGHSHASVAAPCVSDALHRGAWPCAAL
eukprot:1784077-Lingulodinium_polyedra.AAC.1